jgi:hypothetical protein
MAVPETVRFGKFRVLLSDGASPETFTAPCGFTSKSFTRTKNLSEVNLPDCLDPDAPSWVGRDVQSMTASINGEGVLARESREVWEEAVESTESVNVKVEIEYSDGTDTFTGRMHVAEFVLASEQGGRITANVSMQSDGALVRAFTT